MRFFNIWSWSATAVPMLFRIPLYIYEAKGFANNDLILICICQFTKWIDKIPWAIRKDKGRPVKRVCISVFKTLMFRLLVKYFPLPLPP
jgi:hypothetical protein